MHRFASIYGRAAGQPSLTLSDKSKDEVSLNNLLAPFVTCPHFGKRLSPRRIVIQLPVYALPYPLIRLVQSVNMSVISHRVDQFSEISAGQRYIGQRLEILNKCHNVA